MFEKYKNKIKCLKAFEKEDILIEDFLLYQDKTMEIYYAPHNEIVNENAKVMIVGITPGWTQTKIAYQTAYDGLFHHLNDEQIKKNCKIAARFAGSMRKNVIEMLDKIELNQYLNIISCSELFSIDNDLLHTTSLIPYPVFIKGKNYTGSHPCILDSDVLKEYVKTYFYKEVETMNEVLIIPLGKAVEVVLKEMVNEGIICESQCLFGFPHPSGANGHRKKQFESNQEQFKTMIRSYFRR